MNSATVVKRFHFDAAHYLPNYPGPCANMHGHRWRIEVGISGGIREDGMVIDFADLKKIVQPLIGNLDHTVLNEKMPCIPTAENIAWIVWHFALMGLQNMFGPIPTAGCQELVLKFVRVWETPDSYAEVSG